MGKTCLVRRAAEDTYGDGDGGDGDEEEEEEGRNHQHQPTVVVDFKTRVVAMEDGKSVKLQIWDTSGLDRFAHLRENFYGSASGVVFCFDVCDRASYLNLGRWIREVNQKAGGERNP